MADVIRDITLETLMDHELDIKNIKKNVKGLNDEVGVVQEDIKLKTQKIEDSIKNIKVVKGDKGDKGDKGEPGKPGKDGRHGLNAKNGNDGKDGKDGMHGIDGMDGERGEIGPMPKHEWNYTSLRFEKSPGKWGKWVDLKGDKGDGGRRGSSGSGASTSGGGSVTGDYLALDGSNTMTGAVNISGTAGINQTVAQSFWAFRYDSALDPTIPDGTGVYFNVPSGQYELKIGGSDLFTASATTAAFAGDVLISGDTLWIGGITQKFEWDGTSLNTNMPLLIGDDIGGVNQLYFSDTDNWISKNAGIQIVPASTNPYLRLGNSEAGVDYGIVFDGETNNLEIIGKEDEDYIQFNDDIFMSSNERIYFENTNQYIYSNAGNQLRLGADLIVWLSTPNFYVLSNGDDPRFVIGDSTAAGNYGQIQWNSTLDQIEISAVNNGATLILENGGNINVVNDLTIGSGAAGVDNSITFNGETNDGLITWMEDEDYFQFNDDLVIASGEKLSVNTTEQGNYANFYTATAGVAAIGITGAAYTSGNNPMTGGVGNGALYILNTANNGSAISIYSNNTSNQVLPLVNVRADHTTFDTSVIRIQSDGTGASYESYKTGASGVDFKADHNNSGVCFDVDQDANDANACYGMRMDIVNAGAGLEYAFRFNGSEIVSAAVGGSQDKKIRVSIAGTDYFIPLHTA